MKVTIQKTMNVPDPVRAHDTDAGLDLYVPDGQGCLVRRDAVYAIDLGIRVAIPDGHYGQLVLRSSAGAKGLMIPNGMGIIDSGYRGNLKVVLATLVDPVLITAGERICQLIILPLPRVDVEVGVVDDNTDRGRGGFGSTDKAGHAGRQGQHRAGTDGAPAGDARPAADASQLTVGRLLRSLQNIAFRYGNYTPVVIPTTMDADYEQATLPFIMHANREVIPNDWDLFHVDPAGEAAVVIS